MTKIGMDLNNPPGSVWNTMPAHTHTRRMEAYYYFNLKPGNAICHLMGEPQEERLIWLHNEQAITSPEWPINTLFSFPSSR